MNEFYTLSTAPKPTAATHGSLKNGDTLTWDTGEKFEYRGSIFVQTHDATGAGFVSDTGFKPSQDLISDLTMNGTAQTVALSSSTRRVVIWNQGATGEVVRYAFGTSQANAEANLTISAAAATTGIKIPAFANFGVMCNTGPIGKPTLATHIAVANAVATHVQLVQIIQGV